MLPFSTNLSFNVFRKLQIERHSSEATVLTTEDAANLSYFESFKETSRNGWDQDNHVNCLERLMELMMRV